LPFLVAVLQGQIIFSIILSDCSEMAGIAFMQEYSNPR
jgi:hypothetical protein